MTECSILGSESVVAVMGRIETFDLLESKGLVSGSNPKGIVLGWK